MNKNPKCEIYVVYHKPDFLINQYPFIPIHAGRKVALIESKDGFNDKYDMEWLIENMRGDDTGENISHLNRYFSEISALYWMYKNCGHLDDDDFIGLNHYRRLFAWSNLEDIEGTRNYLNYLTNDIVNKYCNPGKLNAILQSCDIICPIPHPVSESLDMAYKRQHDYKDIDLAINIVEAHYPHFNIFAKEYLSQNKGFFANIWVMRKSLFIEYCEFQFKILNLILDNIQGKNLLHKKLRMFGYIAEILTGIYLYAKQNDEEVKFKYLPVLYPQKTIFQKELYPIDGFVPIAIHYSEKRNFVHIVQLTALFENSNTTKFDIIFYSGSDVPKSSKEYIETNIDKSKHKIRWYNFAKDLEQIFPSPADINWELNYILLLPIIFRNFEKIISLDMYTLPLIDVGLLMEEDINNYCFGAVQDYSIINIPKKILPNPIDYFNATIGLQSPYENYFQPYVMVANIKELQKTNYVNSLYPLITSKSLVFGINDALNIVCGGKVKLIDSSWSTLTWEGRRATMKNSFHGTNWNFLKWNQDVNAPKIITYMGGEAPWADPNSHLAHKWWKYARKTPIYEGILYKCTEKLIAKTVKNNF